MLLHMNSYYAVQIILWCLDLVALWSISLGIREYFRSTKVDEVLDRYRQNLRTTYVRKEEEPISPPTIEIDKGQPTFNALCYSSGGLISLGSTCTIP